MIWQRAERALPGLSDGREQAVLSWLGEFGESKRTKAANLKPRH